MIAFLYVFYLIMLFLRFHDCCQGRNRGVVQFESDTNDARIHGCLFLDAVEILACAVMVARDEHSNRHIVTVDVLDIGVDACFSDFRHGTRHNHIFDGIAHHALVGGVEFDVVVFYCAAGIGEDAHGVGSDEPLGNAFALGLETYDVF